MVATVDQQPLIDKGAASQPMQVCKSGGAGRRVRASPLNVSAPFHCSLMQPAADCFEAELQVSGTCVCAVGICHKPLKGAS